MPSQAAAVASEPPTKTFKVRGRVKEERADSAEGRGSAAIVGDPVGMHRERPYLCLCVDTCSVAFISLARRRARAPHTFVTVAHTDRSRAGEVTTIAPNRDQNVKKAHMGM